ncbi:MAG: glutathione peroxidase [Pyrinomonadaceae bacterium]
MKKVIFVLIFGLLFGGIAVFQTISANSPASSTIYQFSAMDIDGKDVLLKQYQGDVLLIVNTASKCGYTPQYQGLQAIYDKYKDKGFKVLGFPANNFNGQEPGTNEEIKDFCTLKYKVSFPMFAKISVKGDDIHPLYKFLTDKGTDPEFGGEITWNFNKFLINDKGEIVARFSSKDEPESEVVINAIEKQLAERNDSGAMETVKSSR